MALSRKSSDLSRKAMEDAEKKRKLEEGALKFRAKALGVSVKDLNKMEKAAAEKEAERQRMLREAARVAQLERMEMDSGVVASKAGLDAAAMPPSSGPITASTLRASPPALNTAVAAAIPATAAMGAPPTTQRSTSRRFSMPEASTMAKANTLEAAAKSILAGPDLGAASRNATQEMAERAARGLKTVPSIILRINEVLPEAPVARPSAPSASPEASRPYAVSMAMLNGSSSAAPAAPAATTRPAVTAPAGTAPPAAPAPAPPAMRASMSPARSRLSASGSPSAAGFQTDAMASLLSPGPGRRRPSIPTSMDADALTANLTVMGTVARIDENPLNSIPHVPGGAPLAVSPRRKSAEAGSPSARAFFGVDGSTDPTATSRSGMSGVAYSFPASGTPSAAPPAHRHTASPAMPSSSPDRSGTVGTTIAAARALAMHDASTAATQGSSGIIPHPPSGIAPARPAGSPSLAGAAPRRRGGSVVSEKAPGDAVEATPPAERRTADIPISVSNSMGRRASTGGGFVLTPLTTGASEGHRGPSAGEAPTSTETQAEEGDPVMDPLLHGHAAATRVFAGAHAGLGDSIAAALHLTTQSGKPGTPVSTERIVRQWLGALELSQYADALISHGFDSLSRIAMLDASALSTCLPSLPYGHRMQLLSATSAVKELLAQRSASFGNLKRVSTPLSGTRGTVSWEAPMFVAGLGPGTLMPLVVVVRRE